MLSVEYIIVYMECTCFLCQGMLCGRGRWLLFADADGATRFCDVNKLENCLASIEKVSYNSLWILNLKSRIVKAVCVLSVVWAGFCLTGWSRYRLRIESASRKRIYCWSKLRICRFFVSVYFYLLSSAHLTDWYSICQLLIGWCCILSAAIHYLVQYYVTSGNPVPFPMCGYIPITLVNAFCLQRSFFRTVLMKGFHFLVWFFCARSVRDTQCGFKLFTRDTVKLLFRNLHVDRWLGVVLCLVYMHHYLKHKFVYGFISKVLHVHIAIFYRWKMNNTF